MARTKKQSNGVASSSTEQAFSSSPPPSSPDMPPGPLSVIIAPEDRDVVKVNNANVTELKIACDDALKRFLSRPELFKQIYIHTDVRLALGWLSVLVAGGTGLYGYKVEFEQSKPLVTVGLAIYFLLTFIQTAYAYFIERDTVFMGKRKTLAKRIITDRISIDSRTGPVVEEKSPTYKVTISYIRSSGGKTLLAKGKTHAAMQYTAFFNSEGTMDQPRFEKWVGELVQQAMEGKST